MDALTILVVEDTELLRRIYSDKLTQDGYNVLAAADGVEAIQHLRTSHVDLVLLDLIMPRRNGRSVFDEIRKVSFDLPILFCTGYTSQALDKGSLGDADAECIQKPYSPGALLEKIRTHLYRGA